MKILISLLAFCVSFLSIFGQDFSNKDLWQQIEQRGEVYLSFNTSDINNDKSNFNKLSFDKIEGDRTYFYANIDAINSINGSSLPYNLEPIPSMLFEPIMAKSIAAISNTWDAYPTYSQYDSLMQKFATDYPSLCKFHIIGTLTSGHQILAVELGDNVHQNENEPQFLYTSSMHGNEVTGYVMMLRLIEYLLENYSTDPQINYLMNNIEIWINPLANPDGTYYGGDNTVFGSTRYNANSVDLNRNYPDPDDGPHPDGKAYQQETQIFMNFEDSMNFNMSANIHGGKEVVNYPWDTYSNLHADNSWWIRISKMYADSAQFYSPSGYFDFYGTGYTNGYQWYPITGGRQDYMNYYQHCREVTLEISNAKVVAENKLQNHWDYLYRSFLNYMEQITYGINGQSTDSITGFAVRTKLEILNHDIDSSEVYSNDSGFYYRPIFAGNYDLKFTAPHYYSKIIQNVQIATDSITNIDVQLVPIVQGIENLKPEVGIKIFPNPATTEFKIISKERIENISITDILGQQMYYVDNINDTEHFVSIANFISGVYIVDIQVNGLNYSHKIIVQ